MKKILVVLLMVTFVAFDGTAQRRKSKASSNTKSYNSKLYDGIQWRNIGPFRGGRSAAVTGVPGKPNLYYMGATGGGVWRTKDAGSTWENISDGFFGGSIGAVAVSEWDNNVIYVGGGEVTVRGNVSSGWGMWKSVDAGTTWQEIGMKNARHIPRIRIHPKNPDLVYAAVMGDLYKSSTERGVYRSKDGGKTWERILYANADAGAVDLTFDPNNPRILYASTWRIRRTPYSLESGGEGSALWKSTDGGDTWTNISKNEGLPNGLWGISGVTVSPVNSNRVWALIENKAGGVYRSDDAGKTWRLINKERKLRQRAWYYTRIYADTQDEDGVYVMNVRYHKSTDGGRSYETYNAPHGDHHDFWIAPEDNQRMVIGDDGGAQVSFDAGENWSTYNNQPTAQFYRVTTDNSFPYKIYGAQQDNSTVRIDHRSGGRFIGDDDWESTAGGESAHIAPKPDNNDIVYGGSYDGFLTRVDHSNDQVRAVNVWPDNPMGHGAEGFKYRFQWNFPIFFSPHNPNRLYTASNQLHVSTNEGQSWEIISPDLTRNDPSKLGSSGGPITKDNTSVEYYCTIFAAVESYHEEGVIWTGSDDGLVHVTRDGGDNWTNVTPSGMPEWMMINSVEIDPFNKGGLYIAGTRYKLGDYTPYLYKTEDYGQTWKRINSGIASEHFTRVVRADPNQKGLLYAGTEAGMYVSFDDGASWSAFQMNLPIVPITDLAIKDNNLIAATQGRSFWMIDDLTPLHQLTDASGKANYLYKPMDSYRMGGGNGRTSKTAGTNHPGGVLVNYFVRDTSSTDTISISFHESDGDLIKRYSTHPDTDENEDMLDVKEGLNTMNWGMRYNGAKTFDGMILWWATTGGPMAIPGEYTVKMSVNGAESMQNFNILADPRAEANQADYQAQFDFLIKVRDKLTETHEGIINIRKAKSQISDVMKKAENDEISELGKAIIEDMSEIEKALYQTQNESGQDPLNFPIRLNNKLGHLASLSGVGSYRPTDSALAFYDEVTAKIDEQLKMLNEILDTRIDEFNQKVKEAEVDAVKLDK
ncbi:WD40/YVTN/BNR-like repeat-containing protein [Ekhidna sp. To15]|uniref:WD40/YVTN/BNR-like repeat-containing protein n=1 Tax=Ekhidna sp. To15 TaxID=3395267 RepID=UPI003F51D2C8